MFDLIINYEQYFSQFHEYRLIQEDFESTFNSEERSLPPEQIIKLLVTETSDNSDQKTSRKDVLGEYSIFLPTLSLYLTVANGSHDLNTEFTVNADYPNADHIIVVLLKLFWILYDAVDNPEKITLTHEPCIYEQNIQSIMLKEEKSGEFKITISPDQTDPFIRLFIDIYNCYQRNNNMQELKNTFYYKELNTVAESLKEGKNLNDSKVILNRIKLILSFLSSFVKEFTKEKSLRSPLNLITELPDEKELPEKNPLQSSSNEESSCKAKLVWFFSRIIESCKKPRPRIVAFVPGIISDGESYTPSTARAHGLFEEGRGRAKADAGNKNPSFQSILHRQP